ncbi:39K [Ectropis obliqua nucleopolyhedrovirus]|uniref:39K n=1 Tax=Ectropis obliqua nucleopolyhedrovirus TaxID=59376 RepID=A0EYS7_9ABAC|nr:39K [Ectropis obliqua nucleopolyhedrovirus]ABI35708.1 39K [Ectropis obliqua nucleopolyhedrovirus]AGS47886.1 early 39 kDa protein [Ectropis obliqua nucleopolyhedrovirus]QWV59610.1 39K [Ectropis obliqua nucleopolyhedrovirus]UYO72816.1 39K [Ectropis obliqua nucleopolyhedrovirus]
MVAQSVNMIDFLSKYENSVYNKSDNEINVAKIKLFEKKKMTYNITVNEIHNYDRKIVKRGKKMITNNKYILFNSWYTKNRKSHWLSSHDMWNYMKNNAACKTFISLFDYIEKLSKAVKVESGAATVSNVIAAQGSDTSSDEITNSTNAVVIRKKRCDINLEEIKESNNKRIKMYDEFYRVLTTAFKTGAPPTCSFLYDTMFTFTFVEEGMKLFKNLLYTLDQEKTVSISAVQNGGGVDLSQQDFAQQQQPKEKSRKRKNVQPVLVAKKIKQKRNTADEFAMVNDNFDDSQMSD